MTAVDSRKTEPREETLRAVSHGVADMVVAENVVGGIGSDEQAVQSGEKIAEALTVSAVIYGSSLAAGQDQTV